MKKFLVPSLLAAGFLTNAADASALLSRSVDVEPKKTLLQKLQLDHLYSLAGHTSHSSHASHASHRSSSGGTVVIPDAPVYRPVQPLATLPGNSGKFRDIVIQVELALTSYGYYNGTIDGVIGPQAKNALRRFQADYALKVTGTVTPEVLTALNIAAK